MASGRSTTRRSSSRPSASGAPAARRPTNAEGSNVTVTGRMLARREVATFTRQSCPPDSSAAAEASLLHSCVVAGNANLAAVAALIAEPARAAILDALLGGEAVRAGELARRAGIAPSTASEHLARLLDGRLVTCEAAGRERRYALASPEVADALEALARIAPPEQIRSLRAADTSSALRYARTCYDHLAGRLGVGLTDALLARNLLLAADGSYTLTLLGETTLAQLGVDIDRARAARRSFARTCLDWSEQRPHLAGALGSALTDTLLARRWLLRRPHDRALSVTPKGQAALHELGVHTQ